MIEIESNTGTPMEGDFGGYGSYEEEWGLWLNQDLQDLDLLTVGNNMDLTFSRSFSDFDEATYAVSFDGNALYMTKNKTK